MVDNVKFSERTRFVVIQINDDATSSTQNFTSAEQLAKWSQSLFQPEATPQVSSPDEIFIQALHREISERSLTVSIVHGNQFTGCVFKHDFNLNFCFVVQNDCVLIEFTTYDLTGKRYSERCRLPRSIKLIADHVATVVNNFSLEKCVRFCISDPIIVIDETHFCVEVKGNFHTLEVNFPHCTLTDKDGKITKFPEASCFRDNLHDLRRELEALAA